MVRGSSPCDPLRVTLMRKGIALVLLGALGGGVYYTPHLTLRRMRDAALSRDAAALSSYIDYPALRESLRGEVRARIAGAGSAGGPFAALRALGAAFAGPLVDPAVDALVTPESLALMLQGAEPGAIVGAPGSATSSPAPAGADGAGAVRTEMGYEGVSEFVVTVTAQSTPALSFSFVFGRERLLSWRLRAVRLPALPF